VVLAWTALPGLRLRNLLLLVFSIVFYAWGEVSFVLLMLASTVVNYFLGLWVERETEPGRRRWAVGVAVALNIGTLAFFKYANFVVGSLNSVLATLGLSAIHLGHVRLPIGISFFTFHALSYVIDVYRRKWTAARNPGDVALYLFFFPRLIAGPIVRWSAIAPQIAKRAVTLEGFAGGAQRFSEGLAKKVIVANTVALPADRVFALPAQQLTPLLAWFGTLCYAVQIYFDFSGYSDMAVGLGKMFGFQFLENFNYPYISQSIREFWRRWHISLSTWFRDYLYIPLGGNRGSERRTHLNLLMVSFLYGLWHGASWTFVIWGLYHGTFLVLERTQFGHALEGLWRPLRHAYTLLVVLVGWILFRTETFPQAANFLKTMAGFSAATAAQPLSCYLNGQVASALVMGVAFSMPLWPVLKDWTRRIAQTLPAGARLAAQTAGVAFEAALLVALSLVSAVWLAGGAYNPFIYYRF